MPSLFFPITPVPRRETEGETDYRKSFFHYFCLFYFSLLSLPTLFAAFLEIASELCLQAVLTASRPSRKTIAPLLWSCVSATLCETAPSPTAFVFRHHAAGLLQTLGWAFCVILLLLPLITHWSLPCLRERCAHPARRQRRPPRRIRKHWKRLRLTRERRARYAQLAHWVAEEDAARARDVWLPPTKEEIHARWACLAHKVLHRLNYGSTFEEHCAQDPEWIHAIAGFAPPTDNDRDIMTKNLAARMPHLVLGFGQRFQELCATVPDFDLILGLGCGGSALTTGASTPLPDAEEAYWTLRRSSTYRVLTTEAAVEGCNEALGVQGVFMAQADEDTALIIDCGASISITPSLSDFISTPTPVSATLKGLTESTALIVSGEGRVRWTVRDDQGRPQVLETTAYHVPRVRVRLFSPQTFLQKEKQPGRFVMSATGNVFEFGTKGTGLTFHCDLRSNLPIVRVVRSGAADMAYLREVDLENTNLTEPQKELLRWHQRLGHFNCQWIQNLMRNKREGSDPILPTKHTQTSCCRAPLCGSCLAGKQHLKGSGAIIGKKVAFMNIKKGDLVPGQHVSVDQYESRILGRLAHMKGKEKSSTQLKGGTLFVDHASGKMFIRHQATLGASDTVQAKRAFERDSATCGVTIQNYRGDNGVFKSEEFLKELEVRAQSIKFSGVGAHHQNGVAERAIRTVVESARTMMLHVAIHWPEQSDLCLWPFALSYAVFLYNHMPARDSGWAPIEIFCGAKLDPRILRNARVWGCPAYVLDPTLQDGLKLPKWQPRSRRGQFLGFSDQHSSTIGLIRNLQTGFVSPQFHVVYDDFFHTIPHDGHNLEETPDIWNELLQTSTERYTPDWDEADFEVPALDIAWLSPEEQLARREADARREIRRASSTGTA